MLNLTYSTEYIKMISRLNKMHTLKVELKPGTKVKTCYGAEQVPTANTIIKI